MIRRFSINALALLLFAAGMSGQTGPTTLDGQPVYRIGSGILPPQPLDTPDPANPSSAGAKATLGKVLLQLIVGPDGKTHDVKVLRHLDRSLDDAAVKAVKTWRFQPATKNGTPVAVWIDVEVTFHAK